MKKKPETREELEICRKETFNRIEERHITADEILSKILDEIEEDHEQMTEKERQIEADLEACHILLQSLMDE